MGKGRLQSPATPDGEHPVTPLPVGGVQGRQPMTGVGVSPISPYLSSPLPRVGGVGGGSLITHHSEHWPQRLSPA